MDQPSIARMLLHPDHQNPIQCWQQQAEHDPELQARGMIARLLNNCLDSLKCLLQGGGSDTHTLSEKDGKALRRCFSLLRLWANGHGALTGDLDALLDRSKSLRQTVLAIISPLCKTLARGSLCSFSRIVTTNSYRAAISSRGLLSEFHSKGTFYHRHRAVRSDEILANGHE